MAKTKEASEIQSAYNPSNTKENLAQFITQMKLTLKTLFIPRTMQLKAGRKHRLLQEQRISQKQPS